MKPPHNVRIKWGDPHKALSMMFKAQWTLTPGFTELVVLNCLKSLSVLSPLALWFCLKVTSLLKCFQGGPLTLIHQVGRHLPQVSFSLSSNQWLSARATWFHIFILFLQTYPNWCIPSYLYSIPVHQSECLPTEWLPHDWDYQGSAHHWWQVLVASWWVTSPFLQDNSWHHTSLPKAEPETSIQTHVICWGQEGEEGIRQHRGQENGWSQ